MRWHTHWYARTPGRRTLQLVADVALVVWLVLCVSWALAVDDRFQGLADRIRTADSATSGLSSGLSDAGDALGGVPLVGEDIRAPFDAAAQASDRLGQASLDSAATTETLGTWLAVALFAVLFLPIAAHHLPRRIRFAIESRRAERLVRSAGGTDLLALRALSRLPAHRVAAEVPDAAAGWRREDPDVLAALAALELRDLGLRPAAASRRRGRPAPGTGRG